MADLEKYWVEISLIIQDLEEIEIDKEIKVPFIGHTITSLGKEIVSSYYRCQKSSSH